MENVIREEYDEFKQREEDENKRINHRLTELEGETKRIYELTASVQKLAVSIENMVQSQEKQEKRLNELENRDGEMLRQIKMYCITALIGGIIGYVLNGIGIM